MTAPPMPSPPRLEDEILPDGVPAILIRKRYPSFCGQPVEAGDTMTAERLFFWRGSLTQTESLDYLKTLEDRGVVKVLRPDALPDAWAAVAPLIAKFRRALKDFDRLNSEAMRLAEWRRSAPQREALQTQLSAAAERDRRAAEAGRVRSAQLEQESEQASQREAARKTAEFLRARQDLAEGTAEAP